MSFGPISASVTSTFDVNLSRDTAPLGFVFFKSGKTRRFCTYYGMGFGLGMSYPQVRHLYGRFIGEDQTISPSERMEDLQKELELRKQVKV